MIVVSDSSPLILLSKLNRLEILPVLFQIVLIPPEVHRELLTKATSAGSPNPFSSEEFPWLIVQAPKSMLAFKGLHPGETAAISLAKELEADFLIMDEKVGRKVAAKENVRFISTIGLFEKAALSGLLDLATTFEELKRTNFHIAPHFLDSRLESFMRFQDAKRDSAKRDEGNES